MKELTFLFLLLFAINSFASEEETATNDDKASLQPLARPFMNFDPPSPEQMRENMKRAIDIQNEHTKARLKTFSEPDMVVSFAKFSRSYYEALIEAGFTRKEALQIVISVGIPDFR